MADKTQAFERVPKTSVEGEGTHSRACKGDLYRSKVPGGWLLLYQLTERDGVGGSIAYMPDPTHSWVIGEEVSHSPPFNWRYEEHG